MAEHSIQLLDTAGAPFIEGREYTDRHGNRWQAVLDGDDFLLVGTADGWCREWTRLQRLPSDPLPIDRIDDARDLVRSSGPMTLLPTLEDQ